MLLFHFFNDDILSVVVVAVVLVCVFRLVLLLVFLDFGASHQISFAMKIYMIES